MKTMALWLIGIVGILVIAGFVALSLMAGSPEDALLQLRMPPAHATGEAEARRQRSDARLLR